MFLKFALGAMEVVWGEHTQARFKSLAVVWSGGRGLLGLLPLGSRCVGEAKTRVYRKGLKSLRGVRVRQTPQPSPPLEGGVVERDAPGGCCTAVGPGATLLGAPCSGHAPTTLGQVDPMRMY